MDNKLLNLVIGAVVGIILLSSLLVPSLGIYAESTEHVNAHVDYAEYIPDNGSWILENDGTSYHWSLNGVSWEKPGGDYAVSTMLYADSGNIIIIANWNGAQITNGFVPQSKYVIQGGQFTTYDEDDNIIYQVPWPGGWVRSSTPSDYVFSAADATKYVTLDDSADWSINAWANTTLFFRISGNISKMDLDVQEINGRSITVNNVDYTGPGYEDGYFKWDTITINYDYNGATHTVDLKTVVIPEVVVSDERNDTINNLLYVLPVLMIVALMVFMIGAVSIKNRD